MRNRRPGGGTVYAKDLKSLAPNGACGFESHLGHNGNITMSDISIVRLFDEIRTYFELN